MNNRIIVGALAAATLAVPSIAVADPGKDKGHGKHTVKAHGKAKHPTKVMFVFKGKFTAPGVVDVTSGNAHVRKGGFVGHAVTFDFANAKVVAADTNADPEVDVTDAEDAEAIAARKLVDKSNRPVEEEGPESVAPAWS